MNHPQHVVLREYVRVGLETGVAAADPHALIVLLYDGALEALARARRHMELGEIPQKAENLHKAVNILLEGLKASLDVKAGGKLAENLAALYDYMAERLLVANLHNRIEIIAEVAGLLKDLGDAWKLLGQHPAHAAAHQRSPARNSRQEAPIPQAAVEIRSGAKVSGASRATPEPVPKADAESRSVQTNRVARFYGAL